MNYKIIFGFKYIDPLNNFENEFQWTYSYRLSCIQSMSKHSLYILHTLTLKSTKRGRSDMMLSLRGGRGISQNMTIDDKGGSIK